MDIAFIPKAADNLVFRVAFNAARDTGDALNVVGGPRVKVNCVSPQSHDAEQQRDAIRKAIGSRPSGIIVSCIDPGVISPAIDEASAKGIPVITYDSDCPMSKRQIFYGMNNLKSGQTAAESLVRAMGSGPKSVAILTGDQRAVNLQDRVTGFMSQLTNFYPDVQVKPIRSCKDETPQSCGGEVEKIIGDYPELDGLFITGLWGLQNACSCSPDTGLNCTCDDNMMLQWTSASRRKLKTVSYDTLPFEFALMQKLYPYAALTLISQDYRSWGSETVTFMFQHLTQRRMAKAVVDSDIKIYPTEPGPTLFKWDPDDFGEDLAHACQSPN